MTKGYVIDCEVADGIAVSVLKDHLMYLKKDMKDHLENGSYLHPDDKKLNKKLIKKLTFILTRYFGEELE
jgi:hypothetical protein